MMKLMRPHIFIMEKKLANVQRAQLVNHLSVFALLEAKDAMKVAINYKQQNVKIENQIKR